MSDPYAHYTWKNRPKMGWDDQKLELAVALRELKKDREERAAKTVPGTDKK